MNEEAPNVESPEQTPAMQRILDNPFILLFIGILVPTVSYIVWGIMQLVSLPIAD